ncbi:MAG: glycosyltransferase involved in cell wall biosynthesis, partial [Flavobacteriales bacterium]
MLSILIPIYNETIGPLVKDLAEQGRGLLDFEILCFDDGSEESFLTLNKKLGSIPEVDYREMPTNLGRSKIRNVLADAAKGEYLLFMDCDSKVVKVDYLATYVKSLEANTLLYGGRCYDPAPPQNPAHLFHWTYGIQREQQPVLARQAQPYHSFMTNNFLIPSSHFQQIRFDESLTQYGHEDTLFGMELKKRGIKMLHLENPLEHTGLESSEVFLDKTRKGIENLHQLLLDGKMVETKLTKAYGLLKKMGLDGLFLRSFSFSEKWIYNSLITNRYGMRLFDLYKLGLLVRLGQ